MRYTSSIIVLFLLYSGIIPGLYAQSAYEVIYSISEIKIKGDAENLNGFNKQFASQVVKHSKNVNYILSVSQDESFFEQEDILRKESTPLEDILMKATQRFTSFHKKVYANHKEESIILVNNLVNQDFVIKRGYYNFNWILKEESKMILGFNAMKAEGNYFDPVINKEIKVEAWYIPSLPLQSGPDIFMGLPGLIAEVNLERAVVTVKKIEPIEKISIEKPGASDAMTEQEYEDLIKRLTKKFIDN